MNVIILIEEKYEMKNQFYSGGFQGLILVNLLWSTKGFRQKGQDCGSLT